MTAIELDKDCLTSPVSLLNTLRNSVDKKKYIFFISMKHIDALRDLQVVHQIDFMGHAKWIYIGFNKTFELMHMDDQPNNEMIRCESKEVEHLFRIRKLKKLINKKKSDC